MEPAGEAFTYDVVMTEQHAGTLALFGGGPFVSNDELDQQLLRGRTGPVAVLPTADAFEQPQLLIESARKWGERLGVEIVPVMALTRAQSSDADLVAAVDAVEMVWLVGDSPIHLRTALKTRHCGRRSAECSNEGAWLQQSERAPRLCVTQ